MPKAHATTSKPRRPPRRRSAGPTVTPFDPLAKVSLGDSVATALLREPVVNLADLKPVDGSGIYALYYTGAFPAYAALVAANRTAPNSVPIYVGKAVPRGSRIGEDDETDNPNAALPELQDVAGVDGAELVDPRPSRALHGRLLEHRRSINQANNLEIADFACRRLVVDPVWVGLGEALMITRFRPVWNRLVAGFGNHGQGGGRNRQERSRWDTVHPGRAAAGKLPARSEKPATIEGDIRAFLGHRLSSPAGPAASTGA